MLDNAISHLLFSVKLRLRQRYRPRLIYYGWYTVRVTQNFSQIWLHHSWVFQDYENQWISVPSFCVYKCGCNCEYLLFKMKVMYTTYLYSCDGCSAWCTMFPDDYSVGHAPRNPGSSKQGSFTVNVGSETLYPNTHNNSPCHLIFKNYCLKQAAFPLLPHSDANRLFPI